MAARKKTTRSSKTSYKTRGRRPKKQPLRREILGGISLFIALCIAVSYTGESAPVVAAMRNVFHGVFGYGYYIAAITLFYAGIRLIWHHGHPVILRTTALYLLPVFVGMLLHPFLCSKTYEAAGFFANLYKDGIQGLSGGAIGGALAAVCQSGLGKVLCILLAVLLLLFDLVFAFDIDVQQLWMNAKERAALQYEEEPEEEQMVIPMTKREPKQTVAKEKKEKKSWFSPKETEEPEEKSKGKVKASDLPINEYSLEESPEEPKKEKASLFAKRSVPTPAEVITGTAEVQQEVQQQEETKPTAAEEEPQNPPIIEEKPTKKEEELAQRKATQEVSQEIEEGMKTIEKVYQFPPIDLLKKNRGSGSSEQAETKETSQRLADTLRSFNVEAHPTEIVRGPSVTRYEFYLDQGVKLSKVTGLADDIALALGADAVRIAPIPDKISIIGIEVPNKKSNAVFLREVIESDDFKKTKTTTSFAVGKDISGKIIIGDIGALPHVLIAGTTGSGKSVCTNAMIVSLIYHASPEQVRFIMVDPKMVELAPYNGIPHMLIPVVTDPKKAAGALQWAVVEMMKRYKTFSEHGVKKLAEFNAIAKKEGMDTMPSVIVVIDELADLMIAAAKEVEESICRVAQMGRAAGVHLVVATQRPSADVITGLMKANIPSRIGFAVASAMESRIILDAHGAEKLVGRGDMLYSPLGQGKPQRVQGCFISAEEIESVVKFVKEGSTPSYDEDVMSKIEEFSQDKPVKGQTETKETAAADDGDELLPQAVDIVFETGQASVSNLQRRMKLGYARAARIVDEMEERGIVGEYAGSKPRQILITKEQWQEMKMRGQTQMTMDDLHSDGENEETEN